MDNAGVVLVISVIIILLILVAYGRELQKTQKLEASLNDIKASKEKDKALCNGQIALLESRVNSLIKYQPIVDVEGEVFRIRALAYQESELITAEAKALRSEARAYHAKQKEKGDSILQNALDQASKIVESANIRAEEIAGEALEALRKADSLENTAKAMKNIIEGYGDRYIIPSFSLIDHLAADYGFTEAGEELKRCRERMRLMIESGQAATCDYAEQSRRETAISFVMDAFNSKVEAILSGVKQDNFGTLSQKIKDAYEVVNNNGVAFRNASITKEFLQLRLEELRWACTVQALKEKEREEQREIKEQIREEEKARREYEKALREAEKEEDLLKKAMEKAQKDLAKASEEQKAEFEAKLQELEERLKQAEEKNQRALSMAQQTKSGHVYIISNIGSFGESVYKVGMTRRLEPLDRVRELGDASVPFPFDVHALIYSDDAPKLEKELHRKFVRMQLNKVNPRKEFFKVSLAELKAEIESQGFEVKWTLLAEAREYRETLVIEETLQSDPEKASEWEQWSSEAVSEEANNFEED